MQYELLEEQGRARKSKEEQGRARKSKEEQGRARKSKEEQGRAKEMLMLACYAELWERSATHSQTSAWFNNQIHLFLPPVFFWTNDRLC